MSRQITIFKVGETLLGLDILTVKEIHRHMELTPIPGAPKHLSGLMNLRGRVVTVVELSVCLHLDENDREKILLILKTDSEIRQYQQQGLLSDLTLGEDIVGFLIDSMEDVLDIEDEDILPTPPNIGSVDRQLIQGVIKLEKELVLILDINTLLERIIELTTMKEKTR